jgi:hypothetical protein
MPFNHQVVTSGESALLELVKFTEHSETKTGSLAIGETDTHKWYDKFPLDPLRPPLSAPINRKFDYRTSSPIDTCYLRLECVSPGSLSQTLYYKYLDKDLNPISSAEWTLSCATTISTTNKTVTGTVTWIKTGLENIGLTGVYGISADLSYIKEVPILPSGVLRSYIQMDFGIHESTDDSFIDLEWQLPNGSLQSQQIALRKVDPDV